MKLYNPFAKAHPDVWKVSAYVVLAAGFTQQVFVLFNTWRNDGHPWLQGDWLISLAAGPIRRGWFGEILLRTSDTLGLSPLSLVVALQAILLVAIFIGFARLLHLQRDSTMMLVMFTPGIFAILWTIDPISSLRKEMIGLAVLIWLALPGGNTGRLALSGAIMLVGGLAHEIMILLLPAWLIFLWLFQPQTLRRPLGITVVILVISLASAEAIYALRHASLADSTPICDALTQRGLSGPVLCSGAIKWLSDPTNGSAKVWQALHRSWTAWILPLAWCLAAAPLWRIWKTSTSRRPWTGGLILIAVAPILLLYPVGLDWGRWFSVQITVAATMMLGLALRGDLSISHQISAREKTFWLCSSLLWGLRHDPIVTLHGFLPSLLN